MLALTRRTIKSTLRKSNIPPAPALRWLSNDAAQKREVDQTKVEKIIHGSIKATGPVSFATYMQLCLSHPTHGYYMNAANPVFGSRGDFITSPEISQVFGELVGIWLLSRWIADGRPANIRLVELGPGRGTLMKDVIRVVFQFIPAKVVLDIHLVETSLAMRSFQEKTLNTLPQKSRISLHWHASISELSPSPSKYTMLVSHEFFDALPIHILQKTETGWHEILVAQSPQDSSEIPPSNDRLTRVLSRSPSAASTLLGLSSQRFAKLPTGSTVEVSPAAFRIARHVGELLSADTKEDKQSLGGCGLIIDYGGNHSFGNSFRAFKEHKIVDVFHRPGECDLTANVDFAYLKEAMSDLVSLHGPIPQYSFLEQMGIQLRVEKLLHSAENDDRRTAIQHAAERLVDRIGMGKEYQVLGITKRLDEKESKDVWPFVDVK